ncbi:trans-aconitate 2-methyltransferase [Wenjunlia tyrosinilytica]|uniref:Trans-aconitate 2-methyltransferase n=1 Tax=Wenjunlia tyrosinilytica TaxID=1544741 RepID=A0A918DWY9_9ACTN|nr:trans-aconitate 2-methyltransferase [Wenjunlia tyrosinilytica]GGO88387.1 trans-aconitate 2-methyltransferase [Wenjunlia tyrosinilytica]
MSKAQATGPAKPSGTWDPHQYLRYAHNRSRPFQDLLARIPRLPHHHQPRITDLGCGPGNVTITMFDRWPTARITGIDNSEEMLKAATETAPPPSLESTASLDFDLRDVAEWTPSEPHDLIVSNATLQWLPHHDQLFPRWINGLHPAGTLAFQVPGNFTAPSHSLLHEVAARPRWRHRLADITRGYVHIHTPGRYLEQLTTLGCTVDAWETTYVHVLQGDDPVLDWVKGTALRPVLSALEDPREQDEFLTEYGALLRDAYPRGPAGTLFPFRRVFAIATRANA